MYCSNCGKQIPDGSVFCLRCGSDLRTTSSEARAHHKPTRSGMVNGFSIGAVLVAMGFVVIVVVAVVAYVYNEESKRAAAEASKPTRRMATSPNIPVSQPESNPVSQPARMTIVDKAFPVGAQRYAYYTVPLKADLNHVTGHFTAQGGSNDIEVLVLDQDGFTNFSNGHNARTYYNSGGYVTTGTIDLNLQPGTYYVVFNNAKALVTNKVVTTKIEVEY